MKKEKEDASLAPSLERIFPLVLLEPRKHHQQQKREDALRRKAEDMQVQETEKQIIERKHSGKHIHDDGLVSERSAFSSTSAGETDLASAS